MLPNAVCLRSLVQKMYFYNLEKSLKPEGDTDFLYAIISL